MPFYEYECSSCKHHLEAMQKISDGPLKKCPECGRSTLKRLMSAPAFRLKGGGWYETDFKSDSDRKRNLAGEKDDAPKADPGADKVDKVDKVDNADKADKADKPAAKTDEAKPAARTTVPVKRPAATKARAPARKPAPRKAPAKARSGRR